jgi:hypothetical protein
MNATVYYFDMNAHRYRTDLAHISNDCGGNQPFCVSVCVGHHRSSFAHALQVLSQEILRFDLEQRYYYLPPSTCTLTPIANGTQEPYIPDWSSNATYKGNASCPGLLSAAAQLLGQAPAPELCYIWQGPGFVFYDTVSHRVPSFFLNTTTGQEYYFAFWIWGPISPYDFYRPNLCPQPTEALNRALRSSRQGHYTWKG